jgi:hypothetical protein
VCIRTKWDSIEEWSILQALVRNAERYPIGLLMQLGEKKKTNAFASWGFAN